MPYPTLNSLPDWVKDMPADAQKIYQSAFNAAYERYKDDGKSAAVAITAVKAKFEKKGDKWVARESGEAKMVKSEELQSKYAELIQEAGRRNAAADAARIKKILELCQELLDSEDTEKVAHAVTEASETLDWLRLQEAVKTEDGAQYPASAYAYVPDPDTPSDWKLRLWEDPEKKVTRAQLGKAAASLSPGGFRGQRVEIPRDQLAGVKRKIRAEYRKLDVADEDMPRWVMEAELRTIIQDCTPLTEAAISGKGIATVVVIKPGLNSSGERYYPADVLERDCSCFEGVKMYSDHPTDAEDKARPERSIKDWVATLKNVRMENGQIIGEAVVVEPWMQAKLAALRDQKMLSEMGISINAVGTATKGTVDGVKTNIIEKILRVRSVDFVTEPGAGGMVTMYEAENNDIDIIGLETFKELRPDLVKAIESEMKEKVIQEGKVKMELDAQVKELEEKVTALTTERDALVAKITEAEKAQRIAEAKVKIDEAIGKTELPEAAKVKLANRFNGVETVEGLEEAIKEETEYVASLKEAVKVKNMGHSTPDPKEIFEALKKSFMATGMSEKAAEIAAHGR